MVLYELQNYDSKIQGVSINLPNTYIYAVHTISLQTLIVWAFNIVVDS